jgi:NADPH-dependent curcumin reductase CurA
MPVATREWQLAARPHGEPTPDDFRLVELEHPDPRDGQVVVRMLAMSVDPYMRGRMNAGKSYAAAWEVGETMKGGAVGRVVESRSPAVPEGSLVLADAAWRDVAVLDGRHVRVLPELPGIPPSYHLGVLGMPGLTAWAGLFRLAEFRAGDAVFVSGAAGAVGSLVGQFARLNGASAVIGSAGTPDKVRWLTEEVGFTAAFDYHDGPVAQQLKQAAPDGIDVFFDNVGGTTLDTVLGSMAYRGRVVCCGVVSQYDTTTPVRGARGVPGVLIIKSITMRGFLVMTDFADRWDEGLKVLEGWLDDGSLQVREDTLEGLEKAPEGLIGLLNGNNVGKRMIHVADPS